MTARPHALATLVLASALAAACSEEQAPEVLEAPAHHVEDVTCAGCHPDAWRAWTGSHHALSMQAASEDSVLGDFDDARFEEAGVTTRFFRRDGRYLVATEGPAESEVAEFEVRHVVGAEALQQYLVELPGGRLQCLTVAWDTQRGAWFSLHAEVTLGAAMEVGNPRHWSGRYQRWNATCSACHSTASRKGYDAASDTYDTTWAAPDVGCQACHGPASRHLTWSTSYDPSLDPTRGLEVHLRHGAARGQLNACAPCHSRRDPLLEVPPPGTQFLDAYMPARLNAELYFADGQPRGELHGEAYVYGSFVQSRMHAAGVGCTSCHEPHGLGLVYEDNALCTQCHSLSGPVDEFPMLRMKNYDSPRHHYHERETPGAACVSCHMPARMHLRVDGRRDHSFRVPRPDLTVALGVPNACNDCHTDRDAAWAAARTEEWYGTERTASAHFAFTLARGRADEEGASDVSAELSALAADPGQPPIVRATAFDLLRAAGPQAIEALRAGLDDSEPLVRSAAARGFKLLPLEQRKPVLALLVDPVRAVRIAAAQTLVAYPRVELEPERVVALESAMLEFRAAQALASDLPEAHATLGQYLARTGDLPRAAAAWEHALEQDPWLVSARLELADLWFESERAQDTERLLLAGLELQPGEGALYHALGLLQSALDRDDEAAESLLTAARLLPGEAEVQYDAGLALAAIGRDADAERLLMDAALLAPRDARPRHALVMFHLRRGQDERALEHARVLSRLVPDSPQAPILLEQLRAAAQE